MQSSASMSLNSTISHSYSWQLVVWFLTFFNLNRVVGRILLSSAIPHHYYCRKFAFIYVNMSLSLHIVKIADNIQMFFDLFCVDKDWMCNVLWRCSICRRRKKIKYAIHGYFTSYWMRIFQLIGTGITHTTKFNRRLRLSFNSNRYLRLSDPKF